MGWLPIPGLLALSLYRYYGLVALLGWLAGNVYVVRRQQVEERWAWRWLKGLYVLSLAGLPMLLRVMAPSDAQQAAPFVPFYGLCVYAIFFLVPVSFARTRVRPRPPRIGG